MLKRYKYDVAISFAEEDHTEFVRPVVDQLKMLAVDYYYYKENEVATWGKDLRKHITGVYSKQARFCVIFVSARYRDKVWTRFEMMHAQRRAARTVHEYVLPFQIDDTQLPEIPTNIKRLFAGQMSSEQLAAAIQEKIGEHRKRDTIAFQLYEVLHYLLSSRRNRAAVIGALLLLAAFGLRDRFTPVEVLAKRLYDRSALPRNGSVCRDGWFSFSQGRGTCSHHQGVLRKIDTIIYPKTMAQCRQEAAEISLLAP